MGRLTGEDDGPKPFSFLEESIVYCTSIGLTVGMFYLLVSFIHPHPNQHFYPCNVEAWLDSVYAIG